MTTLVLHRVFGLVCGQAAIHTWSPAGMPLPVCQRCTGLYAGAAIAFALHRLLRLAPTDRHLAVNGAFLLLMIPLGYHWVSQDGVVRSMSGVLFGFGLVSFLLVPFAQPRYPSEGRDTVVVYLAGLVTSLVLVPALGYRGGAAAGVLLTGLVVVGFVGLLAVVLACVGHLAATLNPAARQP